MTLTLDAMALSLPRSEGFVYTTSSSMSPSFSPSITAQLSAPGISHSLLADITKREYLYSNLAERRAIVSYKGKTAHRGRMMLYIWLLTKTDVTRETWEGLKWRVQRTGRDEVAMTQSWWESKRKIVAASYQWGRASHFKKEERKKGRKWLKEVKGKEHPLAELSENYHWSLKSRL